MEQFNTERTASWGKKKQLVQCWLTKHDTAQHMGPIICTGWRGNIGHEEIVYY